MKKKNKGLLLFGIYNAISVFPALIITINVFAVSLITLTFWFYYSFVFDVLCLCLIVFSPVPCIIGIVLGIVMGIRDRKRGNGCALACLILSIIGLILFAVVMRYLYCNYI